MVSTQNVSSPHLIQGTPNSLTSEVTGPETGEFNFMDYLLGLQATSLENPVSTDNITSNVEEGLNSDQAVLNLFENKDKEKQIDGMWSPILPNQNPLQMGQMNPLLNTLTGDESTNKTGSSLDSGSELLKSDSLQTSQLKMFQNKDKSKIAKDENAVEFKSTVDSLNSMNEALNPVINKTEKSAALQKYSPAQLKMAQNDETPMTVAPSQFQQAVTQTDSVVTQTGTSANLKPVIKEGVTEIEENSKKRGASDDTSLTSEISFDVKTLQTQSTGTTQGKEVQRSTVPELFQKVESMVHHGGGKMTVSLTPPSLGHVEIQVITRGKNVEIEMKSASDVAKSAIEGQLNDLKATMQSQDLHLSKLEVHVTKDLGNQFGDSTFSSFNGQSRAEQDSRNLNQQGERKQNQWNQNQNVSSQSMNLAKAAAIRPSSMSNGRVDIRI